VPHIVTIATLELGDRSYLLHDGSVALAVDPQRDLDRLLGAARQAGVRITHVAETHVHNDYVSGGLELSEATRAHYLLAAGEELDFEHDSVSDGETLAIGAMELSVLATPGHTPGHLAYVVRGGGGEGQVVCSGGSMLFGTVGRTDLLGEERSDELSRLQFRSVRRLAHELAAETAVLPTHGFGSFCSSSPPSGAASTTIADQRAENLALVVDDEERFGKTLLSGLSRYPGYYAEMAPINRAGPPRFPTEPVRRIEGAQLAQQLRAGSWVVDLRERREFAAAHLAGTVGFEHAQPFTTYLGWIVPAGASLVLIGDSPERLEAARRDLARIGRDGPYAGVVGAPGELAAAAAVPVTSYPVTGFAGLAKALAGPERASVVVLDVRRSDEWAAGHVAGSTNVFVADLPAHIEGLPRGRLYAHCASGYRAGVAAALLHRAGRDVVLVDDDWANALTSGLPIEP
jgi:glyoxylase-like metal-dependent hydrolase (beta-lactamase superfamily II)/voltage-gated potassium channel Kch